MEDQENQYVEDRENENDFDKAIFVIGDTLSQTWRVVVLEDKEIDMELDTGAAVSVVQITVNTTLNSSKTKITCLYNYTTEGYGGDNGQS